MDTNALKRLLDENCNDLEHILADCRSGPAEIVHPAEVMEPLLQEFIELKDQVFNDLS